MTIPARHRLVIRQSSSGLHAVIAWLCFVSRNVVSVSAQLVPSVPIFGTIDGYDAGGNGTVCWSSQLDDPIIATSRQPETDLIMMNNRLGTSPGGSSFEQQPSCTSGTSLTIEKLDGPDLWVMWKGENNTFEVQVHVDLNDYPNVAVPADSNEVIVWYRIFMCLSPYVGYCHPMLDSVHWDSYYPDPMNITAADFEYVEGRALDSIPTDDRNITFRTIWISDRLTRDTTIPLRFVGSLNISTVCWKTMIDGAYTIVAHATLQVPDTSGQILRLDMSNVLPGEPLGVANQPYIKDFGGGAVVFIGILVGVAGTICLAMFLYIVHHRNNRVMTMAQSGLLGSLAAASLTTIVLTVLIMPINDTFCRLNELLFIPATFMPSILVGRLWRVHTTLVVANRLGRVSLSTGGFSNDTDKSSKLYYIREQTRSSLNRLSMVSEDIVMKLLSWIACSHCISSREQRRNHSSNRRSSSTLRRSVTLTETLVLIFFLALPQIVVQVLNLALYESNLLISYSDDLSAARKVCVSTYWVRYFGTGYLAAMFVLAMFVAYCSRKLPSAFNEKDAVFNAGFLSGIIVIVIAVGLSYSDIPEVSPNLSISLMAIMIVGVSILTSWFVIMPKIRRVRSGEKVVMTAVLRDINGVTLSSLSSEEEELRRASEVAAAKISMTDPLDIAAPSNRKSSSSGPRRRVHAHCTILKYDEPIPKKMEREFYHLKVLVNAITDRCAEGRPMQKSEWEALNHVASNLAIEFENVRMEFETEMDGFSERLHDHDLEEPSY